MFITTFHINVYTNSLVHESPSDRAANEIYGNRHKVFFLHAVGQLQGKPRPDKVLQEFIYYTYEHLVTQLNSLQLNTDRTRSSFD